MKEPNVAAGSDRRMSAGFVVKDGTGHIGGRPIPWAEVRREDVGGYHARGLRVPFESGWVLSVQWGSGTYSTNHDAFDFLGDSTPFAEEANTAEIALLNRDDKMIRWPDGDEVHGWATPEQVLRLIDHLAAPGAIEPPLRQLMSGTDA